MPVPTGYQLLGAVGFTDKGAYDATATYMENDIVHVGNAMWRCKVDNTTGVSPTEGQTWTLWLSGASVMTSINATDTEGIVGTAGGTVTGQELVDALAERVTGTNGSTVAVASNPTAAQIADFPDGAIWIETT